MQKYIPFIALVFVSHIVFSQNKFTPIPKPKVLAKGLDLSKLSIKEPLQISYDDTGMPIMITGKPAQLAKTKYARGSKEAASFGYLNALKKELKINNPEQEFEIINVEVDADGTEHIRMQQHYKGVPVYGGEVLLHGQNTEVNLLNGRFYPSSKLVNLQPQISEKQVITLSQSDLKKHSFVRPITFAEKKILKDAEPTATLIIYHKNEDINQEVLAWQIDLRPNFVERWQYIINANTGQIIDKFNRTCSFDGPARATARDLNNVSREMRTYEAGNQYALIDASREMFPGGAIDFEDPQGVIWTINAGGSTPEDINVKQIISSNNSWSDANAVSAHTNAGISYEYYNKTHKRNSLNGKGGSIISIINIKEADPSTGRIADMDNAFWNGQYMGYGNGNQVFRPLAAGLDVAGHEMTHGVIENTANLNYQGQSGAINESMADVFGVLIDRQDGDFVVGEDVMKNGKPFLRSLSDPTKGDQPAHMSERYTGTENNGGVHINSGIPNRAFFLFCTALSGSEEIKKQKAEQVYYRALTKYLTRSSRFIDLRAAIVQSCKDLEQTVGAEAVIAANNAFDAVGIGSSGTTTAPTQKPVEDLPTNNGAEFILSYDPCDKSIYSSKEVIATEADYRIVVKNVIISHKPSITDDGSFAYYVAKTAVGGGGTINRVNLTGALKDPEILSTDKVWRNVAVSKDGKKLAAVTIDTQAGDEQYIYIFDLTTGKSKRNKLYNPTYSQTLRSGGQPLYADALEWEYGGEFLIYDAYNEIKSSGITAGEQSSGFNYWDVGLMKGWDAATNTFGDGSIIKVFTNLAKGESIGNPSFAKKSTSVVAFDRIVNNKFSIMTVDFENKGADGSYKRAEFANNTIGFPDFSAKDDKLIFNREVTKQKKCATDSTNTAMIGLLTDKINNTGKGSEEFIITSSLAVWYTVGKRELPTKSNQVINLPVLNDRAEGSSTSVAFQAKSDKGQDVLYRVETRPTTGVASIDAGRLVLSGRPGRVKVTATAEGTSTLNTANLVSEFCINPSKPNIAITELSNSVLLQSSADSTNTWFRDGVALPGNSKGIEVKDTRSYTVQVSIGGCKSPMSEVFKAGSAQKQNIAAINITDRLQGSTTTLDLPAKTDQSNDIAYTVVSGPASVVGNRLTLSGAPGRVRVKGLAPEGLKFQAAEVNFEFCVNPSKPTISITEQPSQYVFRSSASTGNNWYRNGIALNETAQTINVVSTNSFTVQVVIDGCKSEFSEAARASKEIVLAEEAWAKIGLSAHPNPIQNQLLVQWGSKAIEQVMLFDLAGQNIYAEKVLNKKQTTIDCSAFKTGLYILQLSDKQGKYTRKIVKE